MTPARPESNFLSVIHTLSVDKTATPYSFSLTAPIVPAPGALALLAGADVLAARRRR